MTDQATAPAAEAPVAAPPVVEREWTPSDAARLLASRRNKPEQAAAPEAAPPVQESAPEADAGPPEAPSETAEVNPAELPPIERPRSWSKDDDDDWNALPRARQEKIAANERAREADINRRINEAAESRKAVEAELAKTNEERKQYVAKQAAYTQALEGALQAEFADIRNMDDVRRMQAEDPFRFQQWQLRQMELSAAQSERQQNEQQEANDKRTKWSDFTKEQDRLLGEKVSKSDIDKYTPLAGNHLAEFGFTDSERNGFVEGEKISLFDHRMQRIILNSMKWEESLKAKEKIAAKPLPPVQRPGVSAPAQNSNAGRIQALTKQLETASGVNQAKIMAEIRQLRRAG